MSTASETRPDDDDRRARVLVIAGALFARFGFRKTSMVEVAAAAGFSRQGLYFHFPTKEDLLRATVDHLLQAALVDVAVHLADDGATVEQRLVRAFDAWLGPFVGIVGEDVSDFADVARELMRPTLSACSHRFVEAVAAHLRAAGLVAAYRPTGLTARQLAETLYATGRGLKQGATREVFLDALTVAVRAFCLPLRLATTTSSTSKKIEKKKKKKKMPAR